MSLRTPRARFRRHSGIPLHAFTVQQRMARARHLLGDTDQPIKAIAGRLGYQDVFFFTRQFTKHVGVTPGEYRKSRL